MSSLLLKRLFQKSLNSVWNAHYASGQSPVTSINKIYVVVHGRNPGFYFTWEECEKQVKNYPKTKFKKFTSKKDALSYFERSIDSVDKLCPKERKSVKILKNILNEHKEKWKNDDVEESELKTQAEQKVNSSLFSSIYKNTLSCNNDSTEADVISLRNSSEIEDIATTSPDSKKGCDSEIEYSSDPEFCINSTNIGEEFDSFIDNVSTWYGNYKSTAAAEEYYFFKNLPVLLEGNAGDYISLEEEQEEEFLKVYGHEFATRITNTNIENRKKTVIDYADFYNIHINNMDELCSVDSNRSNIRNCSDSENSERVVEGYLEVYTDGACYHNGEEKSFGAVGVYFGPESKLNTSLMLDGKVTNNIAEIEAAILGIQIARQNGFTKIKLYTDSSYVVKSISIWLEGWKRNNWIRSNGKPVLNQDLLLKLDEETSKMDDVKFIHVKGHKGIEGNERADQLARDCVNFNHSK